MSPISATAHAHQPAEGGASLLRSRGLRVTRQRLSIWEALSRRDGAHLSVEELAAEVPDADASTIYRTLELLTVHGLVRRTDLDAGRSYYEPHHEHPHHHAVCVRCGAVAHLHDDVLGDLSGRLARTTGYTLTEQELVLRCLCPACR